MSNVYLCFDMFGGESEMLLTNDWLATLLLSYVVVVVAVALLLLVVTSVVV